MLTLVIPVYNRAETIGRTLRSVDNQILRPERVILVDNNSTDGSRNILDSWAEGKDYVTILNQPLQGACPARNLGLKHVTTQWTMFFDSDDVMCPNHVRDMVKGIEENPEADVIGRDIVTRFLDGRVKKLYFRADKEEEAMFHHLFRGSLSTQRYVARTELFRRVGGWDDSLLGWNDYELGVRILLSSPKMMDIGGNPTVITYQQSDSITGTSFSAHPERWEWALDTIRSHFNLLPEDARQRRYYNWLDARTMILAARYEREARKGIDENGAKLARELYNKVIERTKSPLRQRAVYLHNLYADRLTWVLAKALF